MRQIKRGDVLMRFLTPFSVWHYGIVIEVKGQNANDIFMLEFADSRGITKITLLEFMYGRKYFWLDNFDNEVAKNPTFSIDERIERALRLYKSQKLIYTINKYNCEYYVRRCIFRDSALWISQQTRNLGKDRLTVLSKLAFVVAFGSLNKFLDFDDYERDMNREKNGYEVCICCGDFWSLD